MTDGEGVARLLVALIGVSRPAAVEYDGKRFRFKTLRGVDGDIAWFESFFRSIVRPPQMLVLLRPHEPRDTGAESIKATLQRLVDEARSGDLIVVVLSGHGFQVRDANGDELTDRLDEAFASSQGIVVDDFFATLWAKKLTGVSAVVIVDTCNADSLGIMGFSSRPIDEVIDGGIPRLSISASEQWEKAAEQKSAGRVRGVLSLAFEDAWTLVPGARDSYRTLFAATAELVGARSSQQARMRYYGPREHAQMIDAPPFGFRPHT